MILGLLHANSSVDQYATVEVHPYAGNDYTSQYVYNYAAILIKVTPATERTKSKRMKSSSEFRKRHDAF